jgi:hypothetical protein
MFDLYRNGFWTIVDHHWIWLAAAFCIGIFVGWKTRSPGAEGNA